MKVVLFCGGLGLRMGESAPTIPKPMVTVGHRPILWHIMKYYAHYGHRDFVLCLGHRAEVVKEYFLHYNEALANDFVLSQGGKNVELLARDLDEWRIAFVDTGVRSLIGQRLLAVEQHLRGEPFFLATYGDAVTDAPLEEMIERAVERDKVASFLATRPTSYSFHTVSFDVDDHVGRIADVTTADIWINGGFFVFRNDIFDYIEEGEDLVDEPFQRLIAEGQLIAHRYEGFWAPMDTLKDKHNLEALIERGRPPWQIWDTTGRGAADATTVPAER